MFYPMLIPIMFAIFIQASLGMLRFISIQKTSEAKIVPVIPSYDEPSNLKKSKALHSPA